MAETHVELNQFPVPRVGPRHSTLVPVRIMARWVGNLNSLLYFGVLELSVLDLWTDARRTM